MSGSHTQTYGNCCLVHREEYNSDAVSDACKVESNRYHFPNSFMQVTLRICTRRDNQGAIYMASNLFSNDRSKQIYLRFHHNRVLGSGFHHGIIILEYTNKKEHRRTETQKHNGIQIFHVLDQT